MKEQFALKYWQLLAECMLTGIMETNKRTGSRIIMLPYGYSLVMEIARHVPTCGLRLTRPHIAAAELAWCLLGHDHINWLRRYTKVWDQFAHKMTCEFCRGSGDGSCRHCDGSGITHSLPQAYGNRWRHFDGGVDQLGIGLERLRKDPSDRRVWISSWDPCDDILPVERLTVPCPVGFTLSIAAGRLNSTLMIRSSDLFYGLPYDVMRHAYLMDAVASTLQVATGVMHVALAHPHIYERHWDFASEMVHRDAVVPELMLPHKTTQEIESDPDDYVEQVRRACAAIGGWPTYDPKSEVVK